MEMVGYPHPGVTAYVAFTDKPGQSIDKINAIVIGEEKIPPFYPPAGDGAQCSGRVDVGFARHSIDASTSGVDVRSAFAQGEGSDRGVILPIT